MKALLHIIGTLDKPDSGNIFIQEQDISLMSEKKISAFRNKEIGFVFQFHHLLPEFTALENVCIPAYIAGESKKNAISKATELLDFLSLADRLDHKPSALSGGEQQRVAVARALINKPAVVFTGYTIDFDPFNNLPRASVFILFKRPVRARIFRNKDCCLYERGRKAERVQQYPKNRSRNGLRRLFRCPSFARFSSDKGRKADNESVKFV